MPCGVGDDAITTLLIRQVGGKHETIQESRPPFIPFGRMPFGRKRRTCRPKNLMALFTSGSQRGETREAEFGKFAKCSVKLLRVERSVTVAIPLAEFAGQERGYFLKGQ